MVVIHKSIESMKLPVILTSAIFTLMLFAFVNAEIKPQWTKEMGRYVAHVSFSENGKLVAVGVNNTFPNQGFFHACTLFCLNSTDGQILWKKNMTGQVFYSGFLADDKYLVAYTAEKFEGGIYDQYDIDFFYVFSQDGQLLWMERDSTHYSRQRIFSPEGSIMAKYCDVLDPLNFCDSLGYMMFIKRMKDGSVVGGLPVKEGIQAVCFATDTALMIWTADKMLELRHISGKVIRKISPDIFCTGAEFYLNTQLFFPFPRIVEAPRGFVVCSKLVYAINERIEVLDTMYLSEAPVLESEPLNCGWIYAGDYSYYFSEDGKLLGKRDKFKGGMIPIAVDSALLDTAFSTPLHVYNTFSSANGKQIAIISKKGSAIRYYSLSNK